MNRFESIARTLVRAGVACLAVAALSTAASATPRDQAKRMYDRLVGTPPSEAALQQMTTLIANQQYREAADIAMGQPDFYSVSLRNFITPWTNVEGDVFAPFNDYTALVIGIIRDDLDFREVLTGDRFYVAALNGTTGVSTPYSHTDNQHYIEIAENGVDLSDANQFFSTPQSTMAPNPVDAANTAGVITTRAAGEAFFSAGTNRRMWRFTAINYLCRDMEQLKDFTRPADRIRQDVDRSPGGDSALFHNQCFGCHSGMDPMAGAFAYFEWDADQGRTIHTPGLVQAKYLINANTFPGGYVTVDNRWDNFWRAGPNAALGWRAPESGGFGPKGLGMEVASSRAFSECQVRKVFEHVCFRPPQTTQDTTALTTIADAFELNDRYSMKQVFADVATYCMGD